MLPINAAMLPINAAMLPINAAMLLNYASNKYINAAMQYNMRAI
jgi:hypothetical protein